jgi:hypothetical protein
MEQLFGGFLLEKMSDKGFRIRMKIVSLNERFIFCTWNQRRYQIRMNVVFLEKLGGIYFFCIPYSHDKNVKPLENNIPPARENTKSVDVLNDYYAKLEITDRFTVRANQKVYFWERLDALPNYTKNDNACLIGLNINHRIHETSLPYIQLKLTSFAIPEKTGTRVDHITRYSEKLVGYDDSILVEVLHEKPSRRTHDISQYEIIICTDKFTFDILDNSTPSKIKYVGSPSDRIPFLGKAFNGINDGYYHGYIVDREKSVQAQLPIPSVYLEDRLDGDTFCGYDGRNIYLRPGSSQVKALLANKDSYCRVVRVKDDDQLDNEVLPHRIIYLDQSPNDNNYIQVVSQDKPPLFLNRETFLVHYNRDSIPEDYTKTSYRKDVAVRKYKIVTLQVDDGMSNEFEAYVAY